MIVFWTPPTSTVFGVKVGVPVCTKPCKFLEVAGALSISADTIIGLYVAVFVIVALSFFAFVIVTVAFTVIGSTSPLNVGRGVKVTLPLPSIVNVPFPATVTLSFSLLSDGSTSVWPVTLALFDSVGILNTGVPSWDSPWIFVLVLSSDLTTNSVTVGTYFLVTTLPFSSSTWTVTPSAVPW